MSSYLEAVEKHLEKYAGPIDFEWENLLFVRANERRACHVVLTHGMSAVPMNAPEEQWNRLELCALLPPDWPINPETGSDEDHLWPLRGLQTLARLPFENDTWLGLGHTVPNGQPPQPLAPDTGLVAWWLLPPLELSPGFARARLENDEILNVLNLVPLYPEELDIKINKTFPVLLDLFGKRRVSDVINPHRDSAMAPGPIGKFFGRK